MGRARPRATRSASVSLRRGRRPGGGRGDEALLGPPDRKPLSATSGSTRTVDFHPQRWTGYCTGDGRAGPLTGGARGRAAIAARARRRGRGSRSGVEGDEDADRPAEHPEDLEQRLGPREHPGPHPLGDVALDEGAEGELAQLPEQAGDEAQGGQRPDGIEDRGGGGGEPDAQEGRRHRLGRDIAPTGSRARFRRHCPVLPRHRRSR